jgi:hypothetical protein
VVGKPHHLAQRGKRGGEDRQGQDDLQECETQSGEA